MLITIEDTHWDDVVSFKETVVNARRLFTPALLGVMYTKWQPTLPTGAYSLLHWLISRTVALGKEAVSLTMKSFKQPVYLGEASSIGPLRMSINTIRKHLTWLIQEDFVNAYETSWKGSDAHMHAKLYEINFKNLLTYRGAPPQNQEMLVRIKDSICTELNTLNLLPITTPPPNSGGPSIYIDNIYICTGNRLDKSNQLPSARFAAPRVAEGVQHQRNREELKLISYPTPKKARAVAAKPDSISAVLNRVTSTRTTKVAERTTAAVAGVITKETIQTLLDKAMKEYHPTLPRMIVVAKPFGVLRKRLTEAKVQSLVGFVDFAIREWHSLARQNRAAFLRDPSKASKGTPMPENPAFTPLAYRLPYFLAAYTQNLTTGEIAKSSDDDRFVRLEKRIVQLQEEKKSVRDILRRTRPSTIHGTSTGRAPSSPARQELSNRPKRNALPDDWAPPAWGEE